MIRVDGDRQMRKLVVDGEWGEVGAVCKLGSCCQEKPNEAARTGRMTNRAVNDNRA